MNIYGFVERANQSWNYPADELAEMQAKLLKTCELLFEKFGSHLLKWWVCLGRCARE